MNKSRKMLSIFALLIAMAFAVAACGDDDNDNNNDSANADQEPVAQIDELTGVQTQVTLDGGFVDALTSLKVTPGVVGDATLADGAVQFPITGGNVTYYDPSQPLRPYVQGTIFHDGSGLSLEAGKTLVELENFVVDPGTSVLTGQVSANGEVAVDSAPLFDLDGSTLNPLQVDEKKGVAILEGTTVKLTDEAASLLNDTFKIDALAGGFVIGIAEITVALPSS